MTAKSTTRKSKPASATSRQVKVHNEVGNIDPQNPIPISFNGQAFQTVDSYNYIPFFPPEDNLFRTLLEVRLLSPTQDACIEDKTFYTVGDGLQVQDQDFPQAFDKKINGKRQTIDDVLKLVIDSIYQDGNKFLEIARVQVGNEKFVHVYPHNNLDCRLEWPEDDTDPTHVIRTRMFRKNGIYLFGKNDKPARIPLWTDSPLHSDNVWVKDTKGVERTMLHIKNEVNGIDCYGLPSNFSGLHQALLEYKSVRFNMDNFENNMFLGGLLAIQGNLSSEEEKKLTRNIRKMYTGDGKRQRVLPISSEGGITDSKFIPFNETKEGHFIEFDKHNETKIITANNWSRDLLDARENSGLGKGGSYLAQLFKIKFKTVISPVQQTILNNFIYPLMQIIDEYKGTSFYDLPWQLKPVLPVSLDGQLDVNSLITVDEGREEIGKQPLGGEQGKMLVSQVKPRQQQPNTDPQNQGGVA